MRIVGASTTSAPSSSSARTNSPACSRARVTTMRRPRKGGTGRAGTGCGGECDMRGCNLSGTKTIIKQCSAPCARRWRGSPCGEPRRAGLLQEAAARFARAYAAGGGAEALWLNAQVLFQAGEERAADEALHLWATQVPGGMERLSEARAELRGGKREDGGKREN